MKENPEGKFGKKDQERLTRRAPQSYTEGVGNFMAEQGESPKEKPQVPPERREELRREWMEHFTGQKLDSDMLQSINLASMMGIGPQELRQQQQEQMQEGPSSRRGRVTVEETPEILEKAARRKTSDDEVDKGVHGGEPLRDVVEKGKIDSNLWEELEKVNKLVNRIGRETDLNKVKDEVERINKEIDELQAPEIYDSEKKKKFEQDKQLLQSALSESYIRRSPVDSRLDALTHQLSTEISHGDLGRIEGIINDMDTNDRAYARILGDAVLLLPEEKDHVVKFALEYAMERILTTADINPKEGYPQFTFEQQINLDSIVQYARKFDEHRRTSPDESFFTYLSNLKSKRYIMHELFRNMKDRQAFTSIVTQHLRKDGLAFVEKEIKGVAEVQQIYEQVLASELALTPGWLTNLDFERADREVEDVVKNAGLLVEWVDKDGKIGQRELRDWEKRRAFLVGRSLQAGSQRRLTYGVLGDLPDDVPSLIKSLESEFIARVLAPLKLIPNRFFTHGEAKAYMRGIIEDLKGGSALKYGYVSDGKEKGFYGKKQDSMAILDLGITDPKSNGWRNDWLFLRQRDFETETVGGEKFTLGVYLDLQKRKAQADAKKEFGEISDTDYHKKHEYESRWKGLFNEYIADSIKSQRLSLGSIMRFGDLSEANKKVIWENVSELLPSRIAAFMPEEAMVEVGNAFGTSGKSSVERWKEFRKKLWKIERLRVAEDARSLSTKNGKESIRTGKALKDYFAAGELTAQEVKLVEALQALGKKHSGGLAKSVFPFVAFLDDAPKTEWENLSDEDSDRILVRDQTAYEEGYGALTGLIANPGIKPGEVVQHFEKCFEKINSPLGIPAAQKRMEPLINPYLRISRSTNLAKWMGSVLKVMRKPRSEIEKYNLQADIAYDEGEQAQILEGLAAKSIISDDITEKDKQGKTQMIRLKEENDADRIKVIQAFIRNLMLILPPVFVKELIKLILPGDFAKNLGI